MMQISPFLQVAFSVGFLGDDLYKISETTSAPYGSPPDSRSVEQLLESSVVVINSDAPVVVVVMLKKMIRHWRKWD